jgi:hypothetical protein
MLLQKPLGFDREDDGGNSNAEEKLMPNDG